MPAIRNEEMLMECTVCTAREMATLHVSDRDVLQIHGQLSRHCKHCRQDTLWEIASHVQSEHFGPKQPSSIERGAIPGQTVLQNKERRKQRRCKMTLTGCIRHGGSVDVVAVRDASPKGVRFQSSKLYVLNTWVEAAVPYLEGSQNIFMSGRIVWHQRTSAGPQVYGLRYDR